MAKSAATTVEDYLAELPEDRREAVSAVRQVILDNLPAGYRESMNWGMIAYEVPLERYPKTYNGQPLAVAALASQKNYLVLHLPCVYMDPERERRLREGFRQAGKKLDMGKGCVRFKKLDDLPLDVIGEIIAAVPLEELLAGYEARRPPKKSA